MRRRAMALPLAYFVLLMACGGDEAPSTPVAVLPTTIVQPTTTVTTPVIAPATTRATTVETAPATTRATVPATVAVSYANCTEVRNAGKAPLRRGQPGYSTSLDRDGDGIACDT